MSFLKVAFWGVLILLLLPTGGEERFAIYTNAQRTIEDLGGFCRRNPDVCENVVSAFEGLGRKLSATARMIEDMLYHAGIGADRSQLPAMQGGFGEGDPPHTTSSMAQDTLTPNDRIPAWRGPAR